MMKTCSTCKEDQPITSYHKKARSPDGHKGLCKTCCKAYSVEWRGDNVEKIREDKAQQYLGNAEVVKARSSQWKLDNRAQATANSAKRRIAFSSPTTSHDDARGMYALARRLNDLTGSSLEVDHIEPLNHPDICGLHTGVNFQLLNKSLNIKKSNRRDYQTPIDRLRNDTKTNSRHA